MLGSDIGSAHHPPDLSVDIPDLMASLKVDDPPVSDAVSVGFDALLSGRSQATSSLLKEYNTAFINLQSRRRLTPLVSDEGQVNPQHTTQPLPVLLADKADEVQ